VVVGGRETKASERVLRLLRQVFDRDGEQGTRRHVDWAGGDEGEGVGLPGPSADRPARLGAVEASGNRRVD